MINPFLNGNKAAIILASSSNASEKAFIQKHKTTKTEKKANLFQLLDIEFTRQRELMVKETFELVA